MQKLSRGKAHYLKEIMMAKSCTHKGASNTTTATTKRKPKKGKKK